MTRFDTGRREALRELDEFVAAVDALAPDDWERDAPCVDWKVRDVVEHLIDVVGYSWYASFLRHARTQTRDRYRVRCSDIEDLPARSADELVAQLHVSVEEFRAELEQFTEDDLNRLTKGSRSHLQVVDEFLCEFGVHRADLEFGIGHESFVLRPEVVAAIVPLHQDAPWNARPAPDQDTAYVLAGSSFRWEFSFTLGEPVRDDQPTTNGNWTVGLIHENRCTVQGSDSSICLLRFGRISTHDHRVRGTAGFVPRFF